MKAMSNVAIIAYSNLRWYFVKLVVKVLEVIDTLEKHKKKTKNEGNYMEAQAIAQCINGV